jgi:hypothetical protein
MKPLALLLASALLLAGCATQPKEQLAAARAAGVSPELLRKLERWGCLSPGDLIELKRRGVNDGVALRQLDRTGVDYVADKAVLKKLEAAKVSPEVITAAKNASRRFIGMYTQPGFAFYRYGWGDPYDPFTYALWRPYPRHPGPGPLIEPHGTVPPPPRPPHP